MAENSIRASARLQSVSAICTETPGFHFRGKYEPFVVVQVLLLKPENDCHVFDEGEIAVFEAGCPFTEPGHRVGCHLHPERARAVPQKCGLRAGLLADKEEGGFLDYLGGLDDIDCVDIGGLEDIGDVWRGEDEAEEAILVVKGSTVYEAGVVARRRHCSRWVEGCGVEAVVAGICFFFFFTRERECLLLSLVWSWKSCVGILGSCSLVSRTTV
jgi:hypothetical protein